jgi:hypothetical protein
MKQPPFFRTVGPALVALCLVLLQLATALHFALVPHGFSPGLSGFVHVHAAERAAHSRFAALERRGASAPQLVSGGASCTAESCPIGFAGYHLVLLGAGATSALLTSATLPPRTRARSYVAARNRVLLSAPKTSPPC